MAHPSYDINITKLYPKIATYNLRPNMLTFSTSTLFAMFALRSASSFVTKAQVRSVSARAFRPTLAATAKVGQAEVVLVGCGAPNRGMGWVRKMFRPSPKKCNRMLSYPI